MTQSWHRTQGPHPMRVSHGKHAPHTRGGARHIFVLLRLLASVWLGSMAVALGAPAVSWSQHTRARGDSVDDRDLHLADGDAHGHHDSTTAHGGGNAGNDHATASHRFEDAQAWARHFEDPERDAWQLPDSIVAKLVHRDDLIVADIGAATGYFPVRFARRLRRGEVIGVDIEPTMVFYLNDRARQEGLHNLVSVLAAADDPHLPRAVDLVFLCDTYHHIDGRIAYFQRLKEQLRPGGRVAVVDFRLDSTRGPAHKLARDAVLREMEAAGYRLHAEHDFLPEQYFLVFAIAE